MQSVAKQADDNGGSMQQSPSVSDGLLSPDEMLSTDDYFGRRRSGSASAFSAHGNDLSADDSVLPVLLVTMLPAAC